MKSLLMALSLLISTQAWGNQNFRFIFNGIAGENLYSVDGMENELLHFYCPTYNTITLLRKNDGQKIFDMKASNCESIKNFISLTLLSGAKPYAVYNPFDAAFVKWGVTNSREGVCRY